MRWTNGRAGRFRLAFAVLSRSSATSGHADTSPREVREWSGVDPGGRHYHVCGSDRLGLVPDVGVGSGTSARDVGGVRDGQDEPGEQVADFVAGQQDQLTVACAGTPL